MLTLTIFVIIMIIVILVGAARGNELSQNILMIAGCIIAGVLSWSHSGSVLWTILHVIMNWIYVIYYVIRHVILAS